MADGYVSQIQLPNNETYDIKDKNAVKDITSSDIPGNINFTKGEETKDILVKDFGTAYGIDCYKGKLPLDFTSPSGVIDEWKIYGNSSGPAEVLETQSTLPVSIDTYGGNAEDWEIYGNNNPVVENKTGDLPIEVSATVGTAVDWVIEGNDDAGENLINVADFTVGVAETYNVFSGILPTGTYTAAVYQNTALTSAVRNTLAILKTSGDIYESANKNYHLAAGWHYLTFTIAKSENVSLRYWTANASNSVNCTSVMLVKGSTAPDHYIPYQQGVGERTEQLFDKSASTSDKVVGNNGAEITSYGRSHSDYIPVTTGSYYVSNILQANQFYQIVGFDENKQLTKIYNFTPLSYTEISGVVNVEETTKYIIINYQSTNENDVSVIKGSTAPSSYVPFGYEIPIKVTKHKSYPIQWALKGKAIRDQVTSTKGNETLTWDVIGIDHDECYYADGRRAAHSVTLQLHDCFTSLQFDEREALFYAESAMPAGTYHFTLREQPWYAADVNKTFEFTLTQALAAGSQICITNSYNAAITSGKVKTYSGGTSTTAIETVDITEGNGGTDLGDVRNALVGQNTNSIQRALLGSNNWANSAMRQWFNSSAAAGSVWTPKTKFDRPPSWVSSIAGFLNGMDEDFVKAVGTVKKTTALNTVTDGGGKVESDERFFLLSSSEVYGGNEVAGGEGAAYSYYADYSDLSGAGTGADTNRIKYRNNAVQYWWLRSPSVPNARNVRNVNTKGTVDYTSASNSFGVAPAICIPMDEVYDCNEVDIYIGTDPLTAGETVSKTSTGVDIELFEGENTVSTTLYNKPAMKIDYLSTVVGVGENTEIEGELPIDFRSNGDDLLGYKIYGTADGAGVQTENLFDISSVVDGYINANGVLTAGTQIQGEKSSDYIEIDSSTAYTFSAVGGFPSLTGYQGWRSIAYYDSNKRFLARTASQGTSDLSATSGSTAKYVRVSYRSFGKANLQIMLVKGSTPPETYIPYGYKLPLTVTNGTETKTTDIYIGDSKLGEAEYVDYGEQKIYKRILFMTHNDKQFITKDNKDFCLRRRGYNG